MRVFVKIRIFTGLAGFSGFRFVQLALFTITENPAKTNMDERLPVEDARRGES